MGFLRFEGVVAGYGQGDILRGLNLDVEAEEITCLIGPNGAGKSTVLRTLSGLLHPKAGTITFDGTDISRASPRAMLRHGIVHVPQERSLFPLMTVWENVLMGGYVLRDRRSARRQIDAIVEQFPIVGERRSTRAGSLSGGQQKIVEIARSLMLEPRLILMDEPSMGLDPKARALVFETIAGLSRAGHTVLLVEQNARAGLAIAQRGAVMDAGQIRLTGAGPDLARDPDVAALYLGAAPTAPTAPGAARIG